MNSKRNETETGERHREECTDALIRLALERVLAEQGDELAAEAEKEIDEGEAAEIDAALERIRPRLYREANREFDKIERRRFWKTSVPRALRAVVCVIMALGLTVMTAWAVSPAVRAYLGDIALRIEEEYTRVSFSAPSASPSALPEGWKTLPPGLLGAAVPQEWQGDYYMTYIPEGFELFEVTGKPPLSGYTVTYFYGERVLLFTENHGSFSMKIDTENAQVTWTSVNGLEVMQVEKEGRVTILWQNDDRCFDIDLVGTASEAKQIAESVVKIR